MTLIQELASIAETQSDLILKMKYYLSETRNADDSDKFLDHNYIKLDILIEKYEKLNIMHEKIYNKIYKFLEE